MKFENVLKLLTEFGEVKNNKNEVISVTIGWYELSFNRGCNSIDIFTKINQEYTLIRTLKKLKDARKYLKMLKERVSKF